MRKGLDLIDLLGKIMFVGMAVMFGLAFIVGPILLFVGCGFFFIFPILESVSTFFYKWLYRNIVVGKGFLDEEADTWEKFKWRIIKVVPFEKLPKIKHDLYVKNIEENYKELIRDKKLDKINKKFLITMDGNAVPIKAIQKKLSLKNNAEKGQIEFKEKEKVVDTEAKQIEGAESQNE